MLRFKEPHTARKLEFGKPCYIPLASNQLGCKISMQMLPSDQLHIFGVLR